MRTSRIAGASALAFAVSTVSLVASAPNAEAGGAAYACDSPEVKEALARAIAQATTGTYSSGTSPSPVVAGTTTLKKGQKQWYKDVSVRGVNHAYLALLNGTGTVVFDTWKKTTGTPLRVLVCTYTYTGTLSKSTKMTSTGIPAYHNFESSEVTPSSEPNGYELAPITAGGTGSTKGVALAIVSPESWVKSVTYTAKWEAP